MHALPKRAQLNSSPGGHHHHSLPSPSFAVVEFHLPRKFCSARLSGPPSPLLTAAPPASVHPPLFWLEKPDRSCHVRFQFVLFVRPSWCQRGPHAPDGRSGAGSSVWRIGAGGWCTAVPPSLYNISLYRIETKAQASTRLQRRIQSHILFPTFLSPFFVSGVLGIEPLLSAFLDCPRVLAPGIDELAMASSPSSSCWLKPPNKQSPVAAQLCV